MYLKEIILIYDVLEFLNHFLSRKEIFFCVASLLVPISFVIEN